MTTAAAGACPRGPGGACRDAADGANPRAVTHESPARWVFSGLSVSVLHLSRTASRPAHWEGDLIIGKNNRSAVATLVERSSRQTLTVALPHGYDAASTADAVTAALVRQPRHLVKSLTWDQGREMARWQHIEDALGVKVYFCDPRSPWQRPTNEQTNGLLRRWLPKGTDLNIGPVRLAIVEDHLNTMPRKLHDWHSAHSVYAELTCNHR